MRIAFVMFSMMALLAMPVMAHKNPGVMNNEWTRVDCGFNSVNWVWDGSFSSETCDTDGASVWAYGTDSTIPQTDCDGNAIGNVLGTVLNADYPSDSGDRAVLGSITVSQATYLLQICHYYDIETSYDGGNVVVRVPGGGWSVISPMGGYPDDQISDSTNYYAWCVDMEPGFTGHDLTGFVNDCFDLSQYMGSTIDLAVQFGSDSSVTYPGWFISSVVAGGQTTASESGSWSTIKSLY